MIKHFDLIIILICSAVLTIPACGDEPIAERLLSADQQIYDLALKEVAGKDQKEQEQIIIQLIKAIQRRDKVSLGFVGGTVSILNPLVDATQGGMIVLSTNPGGSAEKAGLLRDDMIVSFDRKRVNGEWDLDRIKFEVPVGKQVPLGIIRKGKRLMIPILLCGSGKTFAGNENYPFVSHLVFFKLGYVKDGKSLDLFRPLVDPPIERGLIIKTVSKVLTDPACTGTPDSVPLENAQESECYAIGLYPKYMYGSPLQLILGINSDQPEVSRKSIEEFDALFPEDQQRIVDYLIWRLGDAANVVPIKPHIKSTQSYRIICRLGQRVSGQVLTKLATSLRKGTPEFDIAKVIELMEALGADQQQIVSILKETLKSTDLQSSERCLVYEKIVVSGDPASQTLPFLQNVLSDGCDHAADMVMVRLGPEAVPTLMKIMKKNNGKKPHLEVNICELLGKAGPKAIDAVPYLINAFKKLGSSEKENYRVEEIVFALSKMGSDAVPALIKAMKEPDKNISGGSMLALSKMGSVAAPALKKELGDNNNKKNRLKAISVLDMMGPDAALAEPELIQNLERTDCEIAIRSAYLLRKIGTDEAKKLAERCLEGYD